MRNEEQKDYYKSIIDNSGALILITDSSRIIDANREFLEFFHLSSFKELKAKELCAFFQQEESDKQKECFEYITNLAKRDERLQVRLDQETYYFKLKVSQIKAKKDLFCISMIDATIEQRYLSEYKRTTLTDMLTGAYNKRFFEDKIDEEMLLADRYNRHFSLILIDIDHFEKINEKYGHEMGDKLLIEFVELIKKNTRSLDVLCRIRGKEFAIVLPEITLDGSVKTAKKLNKLIKEKLSLQTGITVTASFGVVEYIKGESKENIYNRANNALYNAKVSGNDCVVMG